MGTTEVTDAWRLESDHRLDAVVSVSGSAGQVVAEVVAVTLGVFRFDDARAVIVPFLGYRMTRYVLLFDWEHEPIEEEDAADEDLRYQAFFRVRGRLRMDSRPM